jgi:hypothetical protein
LFVFNPFPGFRWIVAALKSWTVAHKTRTKFLLNVLQGCLAAFKSRNPPSCLYVGVADQTRAELANPGEPIQVPQTNGEGLPDTHGEPRNCAVVTPGVTLHSNPGKFVLDISTKMTLSSFPCISFGPGFEIRGANGATPSIRVRRACCTIHAGFCIW